MALCLSCSQPAEFGVYCAAHASAADFDAAERELLQLAVARPRGKQPRPRLRCQTETAICELPAEYRLLGRMVSLCRSHALEWQHFDPGAQFTKIEQPRQVAEPTPDVPAEDLELMERELAPQACQTFTCRRTAMVEYALSPLAYEDGEQRRRLCRSCAGERERDPEFRARILGRFRIEAPLAGII